MANRILYTSIIAAVSVLLISVMVFQADAKTFDRSKSFETHGTLVSIFGRIPINDEECCIHLNLQVVPIDGSKNYAVQYDTDVNGFIYGRGCIATPDDLKMSGTKNISVTLQTVGLVCENKSGDDSIISGTIKGDESTKVVQKFDDKKDACSEPVSGVQSCMRTQGSFTFYTGDATISGFGVSMNDQIGHIAIGKGKVTVWTNP